VTEVLRDYFQFLQANAEILP